MNGGVTVRQWVVAPVRQRKGPVRVAQSSDEPPSQRIRPPVIEQIGVELTTTYTWQVLSQPSGLVMVTE